MLTDAEVDAIARRLAAQRQSGKQALLPEGAITDRDAGYRVQHRLRHLLDRGAPSPGCKVSGLKRPGISGALGVPGPFFAAFPAGSLQPGGAEIMPGRFPLGVECEIAVRIVRRGINWSVSGFMAALELVEQRAPAVLTLQLADGLSTAGGVLGEEQAEWPADLERARFSLLVDGRCVREGRVGDRNLHPARAVEAFLREAPAHGFHPYSGMILFTGNLAPEVWLEPGSDVRAEIEDLTPIGFRVAPAGAPASSSDS